MEAHLFGPPQPTAVTQVPLTTRPPPPLRRITRVAIRAVPDMIADALPPLSLLLIAQQGPELFRQQPVHLLHLPQLELPRTTSRRL